MYPDTQGVLILKRADLIAGIVLLAVSVLMLYQSSQLEMTYGKSIPGTGFLPFWLSIAMVILSVLLIVNSVRGKISSEKLGWPKGRGLSWILITLGGLGAYAVLVAIIGYILSTFLFLLVLVKMLSSYRWYSVVAFSVLTSFALYSVFAVWLNMSLPRGQLIIP